MNFYQRLKELRKTRGITQALLASEIGITLKQIQRYELNQSEPTLSNIISLADYFDVSLDYLCGRSDDPERR